ncbi:uncharacterized protein LOC123523419 [Mercenaria mercenaria]|uniref:uncharacterized protein LOC123523419 n=1 Tax=Mercenaria mercenaria TaxID=6596 RepID=UPI00234E9D84|nr:uncharacterized protein LOC123523419 [Mercenaria mercenaria]
MLFTIIGLLICLGGSLSAPSVRRGALSSIVERGCIYTAHYVRNNYYDYQLKRRQVTIAMTTTAAPTTLSTYIVATTHLNWVSHLYDTMRKDYVPMELFKALVNCGKEYSMYAINASNDLKSRLNVDYGTVPGLG